MHPTVIVGSSGSVGTATLKALELYPKLDVHVGVRDPSKLQNLPKNFKVVQADMSNIPSLEAAFKNAESVFIITPSSEDRAILAINAINAAKLSKVSHVLLLSVASVTAHTDHLFQRQFLPIEYALRASGLHYTIMRLPLFVDNNWGNVESIKQQSAIYAPVPGNILYAPVVVSDIGAAAAKILSNPKHYYSKIYRFTVPAPVSHDDTAAAFSRALGKPVNFVQVTPEQAKQAMIGKGYPEWQVNGILELYKLIGSNAAETNTATTDLADVLGHPATTLDGWIQSVKAGFL